jgi:hypothetical protein
MEKFKSFITYIDYINKFSKEVNDTHIKSRLGGVDVFVPRQETPV